MIKNWFMFIAAILYLVAGLNYYKTIPAPLGWQMGLIMFFYSMSNFVFATIGKH